MLQYAWLLFLTFGVASAKDSNTIKANCDENKEPIKINATQQVYINCQGRWDNVSVIVDGGDATDGGLSLHFNSVTNFKTPEAVQVFSVGEKEEKLIYGGVPPKSDVWMVTGQKKIRITAKYETGSSISVKVVPRCGGTFDLPEFVSPLLPNKPLPAPATVECKWTFTKASTLDITSFALANASSANFTGTSADEYAGPFTDKGPDHIVIVSKNAVFNLKLDLSKPEQSVSFNKQVISDSNSCGNKQMIKVDASGVTVNAPGLAKEEELTCAWLLVAPVGQKLTLTVTKPDLQHVDDIVSVVDAGNFSGNPLLQITALNRKVSPVISSGRYLVVSLNSKDYGAKEGFGFTVNAVSNGGHLSNNGSMLMQEDSKFILSTSDAESLVVSFTALTKLNDNQKIVVLADSLELVTFDATKQLFDLSSPGSELQVVATGFSKTGVSVPFTSVPKGSGCMRTFTAAQEDGMRLIGSCKGICSWIIKPNVPKETTGIFMKVLPNNVPTGKIAYKGGKIGFENTADPFMITSPVSDGAWVEFDCYNSKDFEMSYVTKSTDSNWGMTVASGLNFTLTSPFFPGIYPQGGSFNYSVVVPDEKISYFATFHIMDLLKSHTLSIGKKGTVQEFTGSDLPGDVLIPASSLANTNFDATSHPDTNPRGGYGFRISLAPTSSSQTLTETSQTIITGDKCNPLRCVYIIDLPKPADVNASISVNLTVTIPKNASLNESDLLVWDGDSVLRSPLIAPVANLTKGGMFASRSNKLIVVYTGALNLTLSYLASPCAFKTNTMCLRDRLCMPISWRCDSQLHCSDGSDEWQCTNGHPPTPQPDPAPTSSSGWKVAFWLFMPFFILLGAGLDKGIPMLVQRLRDSRYQQFHDLGDH